MIFSININQVGMTFLMLYDTVNYKITRTDTIRD